MTIGCTGLQAGGIDAKDAGTNGLLVFVYRSVHFFYESFMGAW